MHGGSVSVGQFTVGRYLFQSMASETDRRDWRVRSVQTAAAVDQRWAHGDFLFVVGLEIKREVLVGELDSARKAALPIAAALGGVILPASIYVTFNAGTAGAAGWGIPMATDIAFALGVLALLGQRVPLTLNVFLTALAIVDDIVAVLVIALFYTAQRSWVSLAIGAGFLVALVAVNWAGARHPLVYALLGIGLWLAFLKSGVHATVAGVLLAMTIPLRARINTDEFLAQSRAVLDEFERAGESGESVLTNADRQDALHTLETTCERVAAPMQRLEHALHPWVTFAIMPVFALANAGVALSGDLPAALTNSISLGIIVGLVVGKQVGISLFFWLAVKSQLATLPDEVTWRHVYGASWLGGSVSRCLCLSPVSRLATARCRTRPRLEFWLLRSWPV